MSATPSIRQKMARGVAWMVLFKVLERSLGLISMLLLARLLMPADFGLVAMATSLIALLDLFANFGVDTALVQRADATERHYNAAWTLNLIAACCIAVSMLILAIPAGSFYHEPRVVPVICVLALGAFLQGLENIGVVEFRKRMQFDREFRFLLGKKLIAFAATVPLAIMLRSYWALVAGMVIGRFGGVALSYVLQPFRPRLSLSGIGDLMHVSKWLVLQNMVIFLRDRSSDFIIGRASGSHALGVFSVSAEISNMPATELVAPVNRATLPAYVQLARDLTALGREYLSVMSMIALLAVPAVVGFAVCAPFLVLLVLGPQWIEAARLLQILAFFSITQVMQSNAYAAFLAIGKQRMFVQINGIQVAAQVVLLLTLTPLYGIKGAAWAFVAAAMLALPVNFFYITYYLELSRASLLSRLWRPLVGAAVMYVVVRMLGPAAPESAIPSMQAGLSLLTCIALGIPSYAACTLLLWLMAGRPDGSAESWLLAKARTFLQRRTV
jgi:lipopolysaccharide exporter